MRPSPSRTTVRIRESNAPRDARTRVKLRQAPGDERSEVSTAFANEYELGDDLQTRVRLRTPIDQAAPEVSSTPGAVERLVDVRAHADGPRLTAPGDAVRVRESRTRNSDVRMATGTPVQAPAVQTAAQVIETLKAQRVAAEEKVVMAKKEIASIDTALTYARKKKREEDTAAKKAAASSAAAPSSGDTEPPPEGETEG